MGAHIETLRSQVIDLSRLLDYNILCNAGQLLYIFGFDTVVLGLCFTHSHYYLSCFKTLFFVGEMFVKIRSYLEPTGMSLARLLSAE